MKIYLLSNENGLKYVGKTSYKHLSQRMAVHKCQAKTKRDINKCTSHLLFDCEVKIELLEEVEEDLVKETELKYINMIDCVNKQKPGRTSAESCKNWRKNNPNYYNEYKKRNHSTTNGKKYYCECCKMEMLNTSKYYHFKTKEHLKNLIN